MQKQIIFDYRTAPPQPESIVLDDATIEVVDGFKYLGTTIDNKLNWIPQAKVTLSKANSRMFFLRKLRSAHVHERILQVFYKAMVESILLFSSVVWLCSGRKEDIQKLERIEKQASKITKEKRSLLDEHERRVLEKAKEILTNDDHALNKYYNFMRTGKRLRSLPSRTLRFVNSFVPTSIRTFNSHT